MGSHGDKIIDLCEIGTSP